MTIRGPIFRKGRNCPPGAERSVKRWRRLPTRFQVVLAATLIPAALEAGFASTEVFLPAVGRSPGAGGAQIYTTVWVTNLTQAPETFTFHFLRQGQSNATAEAPIVRSQTGTAPASTSARLAGTSSAQLAAAVDPGPGTLIDARHSRSGVADVSLDAVPRVSRAGLSRP